MPMIFDGPHPKDLVDSRSGRCLIVASGHTVWGDLASLNYRANPSYWETIVVNDMVMHFPGEIDHFYSNDHRWMPRWIAARRPSHIRYWEGPRMCHSVRTGAQYNWPFPGHGTSTLNALYLAIALGYDEVTICGAPLDNGGHYFDPPWVRTNFEREVSTTPSGDMQYWSGARKKLEKYAKIYAQSGRTRDLFGAHPGSAEGVDSGRPPA